MIGSLINHVVDDGQGLLLAEMHCHAADAYLARHFPGFPVMPGVLLLEGFRQLLTSKVKARVAGCERFRFREFVRPHDIVELRVEITNEGTIAECQASVAGQRVVQGRYLLSGRKPGVSMPNYRVARCSELADWEWMTAFEEILPHEKCRARFNPPFGLVDCEENVPEPFLIEAVAQAGVKLIESYCPSQHITALVKIPTSTFTAEACYHDVIDLRIDVLGLRSEGGVLRAEAIKEDEPLLEIEFMLAYASRQLTEGRRVAESTV